MNSRRRGFTLTELIVVIAVIGIIAAITIVGLARYQADGRDAKRAASVAAIAESLEKFYDQNGEYPSCSAVSAAGSIVTTATLKQLDRKALIAPLAPSTQSNSITCNGDTLTVNGVDFYEFVGDGSTACSGNSSCLQFTLKYKQESTNTIISVTSRRNTAIATSGAPSLSVPSDGISFDSVDATWTDVQNAASYVVQVATNAAFSGTLIQRTPSGLSETVDTLAPNSDYWIRVRAATTGSVSDGTWSNVVPFHTLSLGKPAPTAPVCGSNQFVVSWPAVTNASNYVLEWSTSSTFSGATPVSGAATNRTVTGLNAGTPYFIRVKAFNPPFESVWSSTVTCTTTVPAPSCISATVNSTTQITVNWCNVSVATSYVVQRSATTNFATVSSATVDAGVNTLALGSLTQGKQYYFRVFALVGSVTSVASSTATATTTISTPAKPSLSAKTPGTTRAYSSGDWIAWIDSPSSGNWYYSQGTASGSSCPGNSRQFSFRARYSGTSDVYGWTGWTTDASRYMVRPYSPYKIKFEVRARCVGDDATSGTSSVDEACASNSASNVSCF